MKNISDYREKILQTVIEIAEEEKADEIVNLLKKADVSWEEGHYDNWNGGVYYYTVYIVVDVKTYVSIKGRLADVEEKVMGRFIEVHRRKEDEVISGLSIYTESK